METVARPLMVAACRGLDPDMFYSDSEAQIAAAKQVCATCPRRTECLMKALQRGEKYGIWGGLTEGERRRSFWRHGALAV